MVDITESAINLKIVLKMSLYNLWVVKFLSEKNILFLTKWNPCLFPVYFLFASRSFMNQYFEINKREF